MAKDLGKMFALDRAGFQKMFDKCERALRTAQGEIEDIMIVGMNEYAPKAYKLANEAYDDLEKLRRKLYRGMR